MNRAELIYELYNLDEKIWIDSGAENWAGAYGFTEKPFTPEFPLQSYIADWMNIGMYGLKKIEVYN